MRHLMPQAVAVAALLSVVVPARAMPLATSVDGSGPSITLVRDGCGPYGHRSHYGYCKDNLHPEMTYQPGEYRGGGYGGYHGFEERGPGFDDEGGYYQRRCFIRETYDGPVRICR